MIRPAATRSRRMMMITCHCCKYVFKSGALHPVCPACSRVTNWSEMPTGRLTDYPFGSDKL